MDRDREPKGKSDADDPGRQESSCVERSPSSQEKQH